MNVRILGAFLVMVCSADLGPAEEGPLVVQAESPIALSTLFKQYNGTHQTRVVFPDDLKAELICHSSQTWQLHEFLEKVLEPNGFYWYQDPEFGNVYVSENMTRRCFPLSFQERRGLCRAAGTILETTGVSDFHSALCKLILGSQPSPAVELRFPDKTQQLQLRSEGLWINDSRQTVEKVATYLSRSGAKLRNAPPLRILHAVLKLRATRADSLIHAINERFYGGYGFIEDTWDGTPYLVLNPAAEILIVAHQSTVVAKIKELANSSPYQLPMPPLQLARRTFKTLSKDEVTDFTPSGRDHKRKEMERMTRLFETILYEPGEREEAIYQGRRIFPNYETGTIDVVDTEENLKTLENYLTYRPKSPGTYVSRGSGGPPYLRVIEVQHRPVKDIARVLQHIPFIP